MTTPAVIRGIIQEVHILTHLMDPKALVMPFLVSGIESTIFIEDGMKTSSAFSGKACGVVKAAVHMISISICGTEQADIHRQWTNMAFNVALVVFFVYDGCEVGYFC